MFTIEIVKRIQNSTVVLTIIGRNHILGVIIVRVIIVSHNRESDNRESEANCTCVLLKQQYNMKVLMIIIA